MGTVATRPSREDDRETRLFVMLAVGLSMMKREGGCEFD